jgi:AAA+ ATPase superfamily predicted ATPase
VGKTELLAAFTNGKPGLRFSAYLDSEESQLRRLSGLVRRVEMPAMPAPPDFTYGSWEMLFQTLGAFATERRLLAVIDEWPYLAGSSSRLASVLQQAWDERLQHTRLMLVLSGSYLSIMERDILGQRAPLYGRRTGQLVLRPLDVRHAAAFLPNYDAESVVEAYAVVGGMPGYLLQLSDQLDIWANLRRAVLRRDSLLYAEPDLLLREELREPRMYAALLRAIAEGSHRVTEITTAAGFADRATATRYLDTLRSLSLVERRLPVGPRPTGQQWGAWHLADPYLRFWGRWILPYTSQIEFGEVEGLIQETLRPNWDRFVGATWEELARQHVYRLAAERKLPFWPEEVGLWWSAQAQVDVVGVHRGRRSVLLGEARWRREPMNAADLATLRERVRLWLGDERGWDVWYALFSRAGFSDDLRRQASEHVLLLTPGDVVGALKTG